MDLLSLAYFPVAVGLGALHALEPGHAKTMTAAYLIGIHGRWRDAVLLGLSAAATHSLVVIVLAVTAVMIGQKAFAESSTRWLQVGSGAIVVAVGTWMLVMRWRRFRRKSACEHHHQHDHHEHEHDHDHHHDHADDDHDDLDDDAHARAHAERMPAYVGSGQRPAWWQIVLFGAAGGLVPCPASISVMLLAVSVGSTVNGLVMVLGFSLGLALALVGVGLVVVIGIARLGKHPRFSGFSRHAATVSAAVIVCSGLAALVIGLRSGH